jgi:uncharacterized repeat protein (TIGR03847 family)
MTGMSFDLEHPEHFTTGAIGPQGQRVFYLQAREGALVVTLKLEKQQVGALADYLERMLDDLPSRSPDDAQTAPDLVDPGDGDADWVIGGLGVAYDERLDRIVLIAEELLDTDEDDDELDVAPAVARFHLRREQVMAFIPHARDIVAAGRPPCPYCGRPLDVTTGFCPCVN